MPEPVTLAVLGGAALTEGVKFLYAQAGEAIKRHNENKKAAQPAIAIPSDGKVPDVIESEPQTLMIHTEALEKVEPELNQLRSALNIYGDGIVPLERTDTAALEKMDSLRLLLETVYNQPLTFRGESRETPDFPDFDVEATLNIVTMRGKTTVLKLGENDGRKIKTYTTIGEMTETGDLTVVDGTQAKPS